MAVPNQKFREIVLQVLYSLDLTNSQEIVELLAKELKVSKATVRKAVLLAETIRSKLDEIDTLIKKAVKAYDFHRIHAVERNILRMSLYDLLYDKKTPPKVVITEAIRLSKKFATPASQSFTHAVLDHIFQKGGEEKVQESIQEMIQYEEAVDATKKHPLK